MPGAVCRSTSACGSGSARARNRRRRPRPRARAGCRDVDDEGRDRDREQVRPEPRPASRSPPAARRATAPASSRTKSIPNGATIATKGSRAGCRRARRGRARGRRPSAAPARSASLEQVVVEHDALGRADPVDVGVERRVAPARRRPVDLADVDPGAASQLEHLGAARLPVGKRLELVEERREDHRREPGGRRSRYAVTTGRPGQPPAAREAARRARSGAAAPPAARTAAIAGRAATSQAQEPSDWVERPTSTARSCAAEPVGRREPGQQQRDPGARRGGAEDRPRREPLEEPRRPAPGARARARRGPDLDREPGQGTAAAGPRGSPRARSISAGAEVVASDRPRPARAARRSARAQQPRPRDLGRRSPSTTAALADAAPRADRASYSRHSRSHGSPAPCSSRSCPTSMRTCPPSRPCSPTSSESGVDELWCLGDLVGYGAEPDALRRARRERCDALPGRQPRPRRRSDALDTSTFSRGAAARRRVDRGAISRETREFLRGARARRARPRGRRSTTPPRAIPSGSTCSGPTRPAECIDVAGARGSASSATRTSPCSSSADRGRASARRARRPGRRRRPASTSARARGCINPGSVGQPRDGDPRAAWLELDTDAWQATYHRVDTTSTGAADGDRAQPTCPSISRRAAVVGQ